MSRGPSTAQRINTDLTETPLFTNNTLNATFTGTGSTAVLRFNADGTYAGPTGGITETRTDALGTTWSITEPGIYSIELTWSQSGAVTNVFGLSLNVAAGGLTAVPALATAGMTHIVPAISLATQIVSGTLTAVYRITQTLARAAGGALVRGHAAAAGGGAPTGVTAGILNAIRIIKIGDIAY